MWGAASVNAATTVGTQGARGIAPDRNANTGTSQDSVPPSNGRAHQRSTGLSSSGRRRFDSAGGRWAALNVIRVRVESADELRSRRRGERDRVRGDQVGLEFEPFVGQPVGVEHGRVFERRGGRERRALG